MSQTFEGCNTCGKCEKKCPERALRLDRQSRRITVSSDRCLGTACKACERNCPLNVFRFTGLGRDLLKG